MIDYSALYRRLKGTRLESWGEQLPGQVAAAFARHGDTPKWNAAKAQLPAITTDHTQLDQAVVTIGDAAEIDAATRDQIEAALKELIPWRKGPFNIFGVDIDTEWRSDWKWQRLQPHISPLAGRTVLDVGCGSGYHCWRMKGEGAELVIGIDPTLLFVMQYNAIQHFIPDQGVYVLPLGIQQLPPRLEAFDTVFSMGVLYHRRSPIDHLLELKACLRPGGELVLETLVVEGPQGYSLMPEARYAKMRNVWFIPSVETLELWLRRAGLGDISVIDINATSTQEQRATEWMRFESLADFLDPHDPTKTIEGYPAPRRATLIARKPG